VFFRPILFHRSLRPEISGDIQSLKEIEHYSVTARLTEGCVRPSIRSTALSPNIPACRPSGTRPSIPYAHPLRARKTSAAYPFRGVHSHFQADNGLWRVGNLLPVSRWLSPRTIAGREPFFALLYATLIANRPAGLPGMMDVPSTGRRISFSYSARSATSASRFRGHRPLDWPWDTVTIGFLQRRVPILVQHPAESGTTCVSG